MNKNCFHQPGSRITTTIVFFIKAALILPVLTYVVCLCLSDWSLIMRTRGLQNWKEGKKDKKTGGGAEKVLAMLKGGGGHKQF